MSDHPPHAIEFFDERFGLDTAGLEGTLAGALGGGIASRDDKLAGVASIGLGAVGGLSSAVGAFVDATWSLVLSPRAIDAAAREPAIGDLFSSLRFGLRYAVDAQ